MKILEIWTNTNHEPQLLEKWELQLNGNASLTFLKDTDVRGGIMYKKIGNTTPEQGIEYLQKLKTLIDNSSYLKAKVL